MSPKGSPAVDLGGTTPAFAPTVCSWEGTLAGAVRFRNLCLPHPAETGNGRAAVRKALAMWTNDRPGMPEDIPTKIASIGRSIDPQIAMSFRVRLMRTRNLGRRATDACRCRKPPPTPDPSRSLSCPTSHMDCLGLRPLGERSRRVHSLHCPMMLYSSRLSIVPRYRHASESLP
jgi:hypothetical protein